MTEKEKDGTKKKRPTRLQIIENNNNEQHAEVCNEKKMEDSNEQEEETELTSLLQHGRRNNDHSMYTETESMARTSAARQRQNTPTITSKRNDNKHSAEVSPGDG